MTSYCPQTKFSTDPLLRWNGGEGLRFATPEEAQASLAEVIAGRADLIETRIFESRHKPSFNWVVVVDPIDGTAKGYAIPRGPRK